MHKGLIGRVIYGHDAEVMDFVAARIPHFMRAEGSRALGVAHNKKLVAGVVYEHWNGVNINVSIAVDDKRWATKETLYQLFHYPFIALNCECITILVPHTNLKSLNLATKLGFQTEALVKFAAPDASHLIVLKLFKDNCRWINSNGKIKFGSSTRSP